ncbi:MAG: proton-conducting transporter membrane subunit [Candidatus Sericytochromatia bacterium]
MMELAFLLLIPLLTGLLAGLAPGWIWPGRIQILGSSLLLLPTWALLQRLATGRAFSVWDGHFYFDALSAWMVTVIVLLQLLAALYSKWYMRNEMCHEPAGSRKLNQYYFLFDAFVLMLLVMVSSNHLGLYWIAIEGSTLATAFLVGFYRREQSIEAAWKYILICTVGISLALIGIVLLFYAVLQAEGVRELGLQWDYVRDLAPRLDPDLMRFAFVFILIGYGTKAGLAPLHSWLPDAHSEAPAPVSALLSGALTSCALYGILRFSLIVDVAVGEPFTRRLLLFFGLVSLAVALPFMLVQNHVKRLFAYSSVEHIGILAIGIGLASPLAMLGALLHILSHGLLKSAAFFITGNLTQQTGTHHIDRLRGLLQSMPANGALLLVGGLALAGAPPFVAFLSEFYILRAGIVLGQWLPVLLLLAALVVAFVAFLRHLLAMTMGEPELAGEPGGVPPANLGTAEEQAHAGIRMQPIPALVQGLPLLLALVAAWWLPEPLAQVLQQAAVLTAGIATPAGGLP